MKTAKTFGTICILIISFVSCTKEESTNQNPTPVEVKSFEAYVNGAKFSPNLNDVFIDTNKDGNYLLKQLVAEIGDKSIVIQFTADTLGTYTLIGGASGLDLGIYYVGTDSTWICNSFEGGGNLVITKYDKINNKISGTFSYKAKLFASSNVKNISNGVFTNVEIR